MARMNRPAPVEVCYKTMRFLITHNPTNATLSNFIEDLKKYGATTVVRVCEVTYDKTPLERDGITVMCRVAGSLDPIPGSKGHKAGDTLDRIECTFPNTLSCECYVLCSVRHCIISLIRTVACSLSFLGSLLVSCMLTKRIVSCREGLRRVSSPPPPPAFMAASYNGGGWGHCFCVSGMAGY
uniref:Protein tyrosine phosphatase 4A3 n=1 Tax=Paramormyrops kingsleyae TaxID=1676925 RepID=A0A3B3QH80_9TELE